MSRSTPRYPGPFSIWLKTAPSPWSRTHAATAKALVRPKSEREAVSAWALPSSFNALPKRASANSGALVPFQATAGSRVPSKFHRTVRPWVDASTGVFSPSSRSHFS